MSYPFPRSVKPGDRLTADQVQTIFNILNTIQAGPVDQITKTASGMNWMIPSGAAAGGVPVGTIAMWHGDEAEIPSGWVLCDGSNDTPNLKGRFVVGRDSTENWCDVAGIAENTAGENGYTDLPADGGANHNHTLPLTLFSNMFCCIGAGLDIYAFTDINDTTDNTDTSANGTQYGNLPPYYVLAYIMYTGESS
jgi:hypothetical protein